MKRQTCVLLFTESICQSLTHSMSSNSMPFQVFIISSVGTKILQITKRTSTNSDTRSIALASLEPIGAPTIYILATLFQEDNGLGWNSYRWIDQAKSDWIFLLLSVDKSHTRVPRERIDSVSHFILGYTEFENCTNSCKVIHKSKSFTVPVFRAKMAKEEMWKQYCGEDIGER